MGLIVLEVNGVPNVFTYIISPISRFLRQLLGV
jgi:hypothetical protein